MLISAMIAALNSLSLIMRTRCCVTGYCTTAHQQRAICMCAAGLSHVQRPGMIVGGFMSRTAKHIIGGASPLVTASRRFGACGRGSTAA
jgi:hypothetical protein